METTVILGAIIVFVLAALPFSYSAVAQPNLETSEIDYIPEPRTTIDSEILGEYGIGGEVSMFPPLLPNGINITLTNTGSKSLTSPYLVNVTINLMQLQVMGDTASYNVGPQVFTNILQGPALKPKASASVTSNVGTGGQPCGLFMVTVRADHPNVIVESSEVDNELKDWFFKRSNQDFKIRVTPSPFVAMPHDLGVFMARANFVVVNTGGGPPPPLSKVSTSVSIFGDGHKGFFVPANGNPSTFLYGPTKKHDAPDGSVLGQFLAISQDGCIIHQESIKGIVNHGGGPFGWTVLAADEPILSGKEFAISTESKQERDSAGFSRASIVPSTDIGSLSIVSKTVQDLPESIPSPGGTINRMFFINYGISKDSPQDIKVADSDNLDLFEKADIEFTVDRQWISENGVAGEDLNLYQYPSAEGKWQKLPTTIKSKDHDKLVLQAQTRDLYYFAVAAPQSKSIPDWVKNNAKWWSEGKISDIEFASGIEFMVKRQIIPGYVSSPVDSVPESEGVEDKDRGVRIPFWIKANAKWWARGQITDDDFVKGIDHMISKEIISIPSMKKPTQKPPVELSTEEVKDVYRMAALNHIYWTKILSLKNFEKDVLEDSSSASWMEYRQSQNDQNLARAQKLNELSDASQKDGRQILELWHSSQKSLEYMRRQTDVSGLKETEVIPAGDKTYRLDEKVAKPENFESFKNEQEEAEDILAQAKTNVREFLTGATDADEFRFRLNVLCDIIPTLLQTPPFHNYPICQADPDGIQPLIRPVDDRDGFTDAQGAFNGVLAIIPGHSEIEGLEMELAPQDLEVYVGETAWTKLTVTNTWEQDGNLDLNAPDTTDMSVAVEELSPMIATVNTIRPPTISLFGGDSVEVWIGLTCSEHTGYEDYVVDLEKIGRSDLPDIEGSIRCVEPPEDDEIYYTTHAYPPYEPIGIIIPPHDLELMVIPDDNEDGADTESGGLSYTTIDSMISIEGPSRTGFVGETFTITYSVQWNGEGDSPPLLFAPLTGEYSIAIPVDAQGYELHTGEGREAYLIGEGQTVTLGTGQTELSWDFICLREGSTTHQLHARANQNVTTSSWISSLDCVDVVGAVPPSTIPPEESASSGSEQSEESSSSSGDSGDKSADKKTQAYVAEQWSDTSKLCSDGALEINFKIRDENEQSVADADVTIRMYNIEGELLQQSTPTTTSKGIASAVFAVNYNGHFEFIVHNVQKDNVSYNPELNWSPYFPVDVQCS